VHALEAARERARDGLVRLSGPRGSLGLSLARQLAEERGGPAIYFPAKALPYEEARRLASGGALIFDEDAAGFSPEALPDALLVIVAAEESPVAVRVPRLGEIEPVAAAYAILAYVAPASPRGLTAEAEAAIAARRFGGDVEELALVLARAALVTEGGAPLPASAFVQAPAAPEVGVPPFHDAVLEFKRGLISRALEQAGGNRSRAAALLGLQRTYLYRLVRQLEIDDDDPKAFDEPPLAE
jgi:hypothetical protein